jgi:hypothetical protein
LSDRNRANTIAQSPPRRRLALLELDGARMLAGSAYGTTAPVHSPLI